MHSDTGSVGYGEPQVVGPYDGLPLLTQAMAVGNGAVPEEERLRLLRYLEAVTTARKTPLHVSVAFNAAYFGFHLAGDGYGRSPLQLDDFPSVTFGEHTPPLPVGAMVRVTTGSQPLYAEICYKEGAHPEVDELGNTPAWVSGSPAGTEGPGAPGARDAAKRRELLVPDLHAFGPGLSLSPAQLHRLHSRQRWINADGHILVEAVYASKETAAQDDLTAYAHYLLSTGRPQLMSPFVAMSVTELVGGADDTTLLRGLLRLLETVRRVLHSSDLLRMWGPYAMTRESLAAGWQDTGPLGGDDMRTLLSSFEHGAQQTRRHYAMNTPVTIYTALGPRLRSFPGAAESLHGVDYASAVCRANVTIADFIRRDSENGLFSNGTRVHLDDSFEGGGVWSSQYPGVLEPAQDPLTPAGRGWASSQTVTASSFPEPEAAPVDDPLADDANLGPVELLRVTDEVVVYRQPLRLAHLTAGLALLHPLVAEELRPAGDRRQAVLLEIDHGGPPPDGSGNAQETYAEVTGHTGYLVGVTWPNDFFPGLLLQFHWSRGGRTLHAATVPLKNPVQFGDRLLGHCYDARVLTREDAPGSDRSRDTAAGLAPRELVMRTVRRCGLLTPGGHALLDRAFLPRAVYGGVEPAHSQRAALESAIAELLAQRVLEPALGSRDPAGQPHYPAHPAQRVIQLIGYMPPVVRVPRPWGVSEPQEDMHGVQYVPGHLRRLLPGSSPSDAQREAFREHCRLLGKADGWELPDGYTFVTQYTRGQ
ncbi:hypothetical protein GCM10009802_16220 [Streptomyces synnematoformans]|uniref:Uncharacterized protein n=2 Tax=Streptomyces synnematoformans TaxID=415721 RepID=A0ABP5JJJ4_9ACTN